MIRVADVTKSAEFYRLLGFGIGDSVPRQGPPFHWAWLYQPKTPNWKIGANLMLVAGLAPESAEVKAKAILFYLYARDLKSLRDELMAKGIKAGEISYPEHLPEGEFRLQDPDGYTLMMAQSGRDTP
jgi:catechol 2,3-dioxygenase-like lactoylglutathione lyase family enzyme